MLQWSWSYHFSDPTRVEQETWTTTISVGRSWHFWKIKSGRFGRILIIINILDKVVARVFFSDAAICLLGVAGWAKQESLQQTPTGASCRSTTRVSDSPEGPPCLSALLINSMASSLYLKNYKYINRSSYCPVYAGCETLTTLWKYIFLVCFPNKMKAALGCYVSSQSPSHLLFSSWENFARPGD